MMQIFPGALLFDLRSTHGLPLDFALDRIMNVEHMPVEWPGFIEAARANGWWDFQTFEVVQHALIDAQVPRDTTHAILQRFKLYVLKVEK